MKEIKDKCVVFLSEGGYKISTVFGKILFGGKKFQKLRDAMSFCMDSKLDYFVA